MSDLGHHTQPASRIHICGSGDAVCARCYPQQDATRVVQARPEITSYALRLRFRANTEESPC